MWRLVADQCLPRCVFDLSIQKLCITMTASLYFKRIILMHLITAFRIKSVYIVQEFFVFFMIGFFLVNTPESPCAKCAKNARCVRGKCTCNRGYHGDGINSCQSKYWTRISYHWDMHTYQKQISASWENWSVTNLKIFI